MISVLQQELLEERASFLSVIVSFVCRIVYGFVVSPKVPQSIYLFLQYGNIRDIL